MANIMKKTLLNSLIKRKKSGAMHIEEKDVKKLAALTGQFLMPEYKDNEVQMQPSGYTFRYQQSNGVRISRVSDLQYKKLQMAEKNGVNPNSETAIHLALYSSLLTLQTEGIVRDVKTEALLEDGSESLQRDVDYSPRSDIEYTYDGVTYIVEIKVGSKDRCFQGAIDKIKLRRHKAAEARGIEFRYLFVVQNMSSDLKAICESIGVDVMTIKEYKDMIKAFSAETPNRVKRSYITGLLKSISKL